MNLMCPSFVPEPPDFQLNNNQRRVTVIKKQPFHREERREAAGGRWIRPPPPHNHHSHRPPRLKTHNPRGAEMDGQLEASEDKERVRGGRGG